MKHESRYSYWWFEFNKRTKRIERKRCGWFSFRCQAKHEHFLDLKTSCEDLRR